MLICLFRHRFAAPGRGVRSPCVPRARAFSAPGANSPPVDGGKPVGHGPASFARIVAAGLTVLSWNMPSAVAAADAARGAKVFGACAACHALEPGRHLSGPSLAKIYGREAGTVEGFMRYSKALKNSDIVWNDKTLDAWLKDPQALVPDNLMAFPGIRDANARTDLVAFLKQAGAEGAAKQTPPGGGMMGGMMGGPQLPDLKQLPAENQVKGLRYCRDSYFVTLATGETVPFWEFNLRFKTDSSANGPSKSQPVMVGAGMRGDRASIVFADPAEISRFVARRCE